MNTDKTILNDAKKRTPTQRDRLLSILRKAGSNGVLNIDLVGVCIGYRSRIAELYQMGYKIDVENVDRGVCIYTLREEPEVPITNVPTAISVLTKEISEKYKGAITPEALVELLQDMNFNVVRKSGSHKTATA
ncbi:TPA: hypothetical protein QC364_000685 [Bacillus cereus]|uniref:hypothetical protein n=1 Tax=Bacillus paranthracis TaxID=2026186 RepID=UPI002D790156|nr:hypothetical protein [Bacillus paranthracis]HDR8453895.1 hypothetical protein [Bacillus cereus]